MMPAILGGQPVRTVDWPVWPVHDEREVAAVTAVIRSGNWGGFPYPGPQTSNFLTDFLAFQGGEFAVACMNGTVTMEVALRAAGIGWGDEVIVPAYTFQATAYAPLIAGAIPVIVDIDPETLCIDPKAVETAVTEQTKAIIPVHVGSQMADMDAIMEIAKQHHLIVIEDCAHACGAQWHGQGAGTIGHFGSFSLQSSKTLTTGEGGILICKTADFAQRAASIINCGRPNDDAEAVATLGNNYRMTELQAALGQVALTRMPAQTNERREMALYLEACLSDLPAVRLLKHDPRVTRRSVFSYVFAIDMALFGLSNAQICLALQQEGIPCHQGYPPLYDYDLFQPKLSRLPVPSAFPHRFNYDDTSLPVVAQSSQTAVWLEESIFRAGKAGVDDVIMALKKVITYHDDIAKLTAL